MKNIFEKWSFSTVAQVFSSAASSYDLMNDVMSLGCHHVWKFSFVQHLDWAGLPRAFSYVDMACGTGDIGHMVRQRNKMMKKDIAPIFVDPNPHMIAEGRLQNPCSSIQWRQEDAETCALSENSIHLYTIAFGLRNVSCRAQTLSNAMRMLASGGQFWCLEFSWPQHPVMATLYDGYLGLLPVMGQMVAQNPDAYAYLADSIRSFPPPSVIEKEMQDAGFTHTGVRSLSNGLVSVFWGYKK